MAYQRAGNTTALIGRYAVRLWDTATGRELHDLPGHLNYVEALAFSPDGRLLSGGVDTTVLAWDVHAAKPPADRK